MSGQITHMDAVAIRKAAIAGWEPFSYKFAGDAVIIEGGIPKILTRGPRKGKKSWTGCKATTVVVTRAEQVEQEKAYVAETGNCGTCYGKGQVFASWDHIEGTKYRECKHCTGTGKEPA